SLPDSCRSNREGNRLFFTDSQRRRDIMKASRTIACIGSLACTILLAFYPTELQSQGVVVNCDSGGTIRGALASLKPGDTLTVSGVCNENVSIEAEVSRITLDGRGTATVQGTNPGVNVISIRGREITVK